MVQRTAENRAGGVKPTSFRQILRAILIALIFASAGTLILVYHINPTDVVELDLGDVVPKNVLAPRQIVYTSTIETEAARERARNSISTIFSPPDPNVARQQVNRLRKIFDYLESVRGDSYGSLAEKSEWVAAIPDLGLTDIIVDQILIMNDQAWAEMREEAIAILDEAMRTEIRESQVASTRRQLPTLVALDTPDEQSAVIVAIIEDLIKPNTFPDETRTTAERQAAAASVEPVKTTIEQDELIISAGRIVGPRDLEALQALSLEQPEFSWLEDFVAPAVLILLTTIIISVYLARYASHILADDKRLMLLAFLLLAFIAIAKITIPGRGFVAFFYPISALTMMVVILIDTQLAFLLTTVLALVAGYITTEAPTIAIYLILSGWTGALAIGKDQGVNALLWAGIYVGLVNAGIILAFNLSNSLELVNLGLLLLIGLLNGIFSAGLAAIGLSVIGNLVGISTSIQLLDLGRPTHPLLRQLLLKAPGTYHHSLMVSNLGEQAAERIGANALLVRVMAYYHDVGKMQRPYFFIENQPEGINVHEKLDPQISAQIIISHVKDGLDLAQKYRLPPALKAGIAQHHGTSLVKYFYYQAVEAAKDKELQVDAIDFLYPGPKPQTKENGILMLADVSESTVRALKPGSAEEIYEIVQKVIADKLAAGQLDECDLTIADLHHIRTAFVDILQGVHHPRIKYPEQIKIEVETGRAQTLKELPAPEASAGTGGSVPTGPAQPRPGLSLDPPRPATLIRRE
ncbi:MAG TPA: HDIG domain-containing protein [Anaerolineae bacterium]|nr:HDIG domain-containing protein [Anaerolineae bacterium]